jgi:Xaa-Pro aminopeptidase
MESFPYEERLKSVRKILDLNQLDGILFSSLENIRYLCGFTGSDGALLIIRNESFFLTDSRYWTQSEEEARGSQIVHYRKKMEGILSLLLDLKLIKVGFESASLSFSAHQFVTERLPPEAKLIPLEEEIKNLRALKDEQELALLRTSIEIASKAYLEVLERLKEGRVEREAALEMEWSMKRNGAGNLGFDIIIASGKRSALPHGKASDKKVERGDFILIDFGSEFEGYHSDQTRTVICGRPSSEQQKVYRIVKEAHDRAIERVRPGMRISELDQTAREHIRDEGYGDYFGHGLGHGIGIAVHEDPAINSENKGVVEEGMVFTIEPGIYIPNWGGVRIEDMVLITQHGAELLTYLPTELKEI